MGCPRNSSGARITKGIQLTANYGGHAPSFYGILYEVLVSEVCRSMNGKQILLQGGIASRSGIFVYLVIR